jgi:glucose/arabinose dehydrogenase
MTRRAARRIRRQSGSPAGRRSALPLRVLAVAIVGAGIPAPHQAAHAGWAGMQRVASGLVQPLGVTHAPGDPHRLFITTKPGVIRVLDLQSGALLPTPFLTIPDTDATAFESGLLGLAFHPDYQTNGKFYVHVNVDNGGGIIIEGEPSPFDTVIREYTVSANPDIANPTPRQILAFPQPRSFHNGGWLDFSPRDGYLYAAIGEGGLPGLLDPTARLLGSILRLDVDGDDFPEADRNYAIPADNPFVGDDPKLDELWSYGLRNPWRASFDRATHDLWIGDVGEATAEEINFQPADSPGGQHYGWPLREGFGPRPNHGGPKPPGAVDPVYAYPHPIAGEENPLAGSSVIGGFVYRGPDPTLRGDYIFSDSVGARKFWSFDPADPAGTAANITAHLAPDVGLAALAGSFGEDLMGNLYVAYVSSGEVYRLKTDALTPGDFNADGYVDGVDLAAWRTGFGMTSGAAISHGDADGDGDVDGADLLVWQQNVGVDPLAVAASSLSGQHAVPEPRAWIVALVSVTILLREMKMAERSSREARRLHSFTRILPARWLH